MRKKNIYLLLLVAWINFGFSLECNEGEVDLGWGDCNLFFHHNSGCMESGCFSISETIELNFSYIFLGVLPNELGLLTNLNYIHLSDCGISGEIPSSIGNLEKLISLQIYDNNHDLPDSLASQIDSKLTGTIPQEIGNLQSLQQIQLSNNELVGEIPIQISNLQYLLSLDLSGNQLTGNIPEQIENLENLKNLLLSDNQFTGQIPYFLGEMDSLEMIDMNNNSFIGEIPANIGNLSSLVWLSLSNNELDGEIPYEITTLENVYLLNLSSNNLYGSIPSSIDNMNLWIVNLRNNQLSGEIPAEFSNLNNLAYLYLDNNQLSGTIPMEFSDLEIAYLTLNNNQLTGEIPLSFCNIFSLDISNNFFCPDYPECIVEEQLGFQDISNCNLPGSSCMLDSGSEGFFDCELCCWDIGLLSWLGDGYCDQQGGCGWEGPQYNCVELSYDCGDCESYENDFSGLCYECNSGEGDLNQDLSVNVLDVILLVNCILEVTCDQCTDINGDMNFDIIDVVQLVNIIIS